MLDLFVFFTISVHLGYSSWRTMHNNPHLLEYMDCDPNTWRWWDRLLLRLHKRPLSFQTLEALTWILTLNILFFVLRPTGLGLLVFLLVVIAISIGGYVKTSPMYPLLLLVAFVHPVFLIPLVLVKEVGGWFGVGVLLTQTQIIEAVIFGAIAGSLYVVLRVLSKRDRTRLDNTAPLFTPPYYLKAIRKTPATMIRDLSVTAVLFVCYFWTSPLLFLWLAVPLLLFSLPWESHLWFPVLLIILGGA